MLDAGDDDERRQIEAAADRYEEHMPLEEGDDDDVGRARDYEGGGDEEARGASESDASERTSSSSSSAQEEDADDATPSLASAAMGGDLARDEHLSCVSLGESSSAVDILRPTVSECAHAAPPPPLIAMPTGLPKELFPPPGMSTSSSLALSPDDAPSACCSAACREDAKWKDARLRELQRALDHMVDAMAIQQRDLAAQRAFLARQSEQCMRLSAALQHEKLALQIERERERAQRAARGGGTPTAAAGGSSGSRPATPSSRRSTPRAGASAKKLKGVLSTFAGASPRTAPAAAADARSSSWKASSRSASESKLAPAALPLAEQPSRAADDSSLAEERRSLAALEVRATLPESLATAASVAMAAKSRSEAAMVALSDVSLQDIPVRVGSRSATNDMAAVVAAAAAAAASSPGGSGRKPSLGERFRNLRWKHQASAS